MLFNINYFLRNYQSIRQSTAVWHKSKKFKGRIVVMGHGIRKSRA